MLKDNEKPGIADLLHLIASRLSKENAKAYAKNPKPTDTEEPNWIDQLHLISARLSKYNSKGK